MNYNSIKDNLHGPEEDAVQFIAYVTRLANEKNHRNQPKNPWMQHRSLGYITLAYNQVVATGLVFDGKNITLISTGISYNYQAYKNKMLLAYPETILDIDLVYKNDTFTFDKNSGKVAYTHNIADPFSRNDDDILGGYCVIKNKRGEFLTTLTRDEINKHRAVAKTDKIWAQWFVEMAKKTLIKKASRLHFDDVYDKINSLDNENIDLNLPVDIDLGVKGEVEAIDDLKSLEKYFHANCEKHRSNVDGFYKLITIRKKELTDDVNSQHK